MAEVRRSCGSVLVSEPSSTGGDDDGGRRDTGSGDDGGGGAGGEPTSPTSQPPSIAGIGPLTADNPRAIAAGAGAAFLGAILLTR